MKIQIIRKKVYKGENMKIKVYNEGNYFFVDVYAYNEDVCINAYLSKEKRDNRVNELIIKHKLK